MFQLGHLIIYIYIFSSLLTLLMINIFTILYFILKHPVFKNHPKLQ